MRMTCRYMAICLGLAMLISSAAYSGEPAVSKIAEFQKPEDLKFKAEIDGSTQNYAQMLAKDFDAEKPHDVLIALHGHGSDRWQYIYEARGECKGARDFAATHGMIYISPDYRARTSWMGPAAEADLVQLITLLRQQHKINRVFLTGGSMGGTSVLIFTALHPELIAGVSSLNGVANMVGYQNFQDAISISYGGDKTKNPDEYKKRSPELFPEKFTMPVAFSVGGQDTIVPPDSVRRLAEKLKKQNEKIVLMIDQPTQVHATSYEDTVKTLEFMLKAADVKSAK